MKPGQRERLKNLAAVCFWIAVWAVASAVVDKPLLLPGPAAVAVQLARQLATAQFWAAVGTSLGRVLLGVLSGAVLGVALAALCARFSLLRAAVSPLLTVIKSTPVASFTILVLLWLRRELVPAFIAALIVLPVVWANVSSGIRETDPLLLELARSCRLSRWRTLRRIRIPTVLPQFRAALQSSLGFGWKAGVAAEVLTLPKNSIGRMIYESKLYLQTEALFAWTAAVVLLSLVIEMLLLRLLAGRRNARTADGVPDTAATQAPDGPAGPDKSHAPSDRAGPVLALDSVSLSFGAGPAFSGLSLRLGAGERVAVMGPSGCGKTSLLRLAAGLLEPSSGTAVRSTAQIAVCFQEPRLLPWRTAAENVNLVLSDRAATMAEAERQLASLGLGAAAAKQYPAALSGGMQQRVALARALAQKGDLLLLDEPFKALDAPLRAQVIRTVSKESRGAAVLLVTHDEAEAEAFGCRVLRFPELTAQADPEQ